MPEPETTEALASGLVGKALSTTDPSLTASRHSGQRRSQANWLITAPMVTTPDWSVR